MTTFIEEVSAELLSIVRREGVDPFVALYRFEKSKHVPARFTTSLRHPNTARNRKAHDHWNADSPRDQDWTQRDAD